ncbi:MAG: ABC transporter permease [Ruminococcus sp.]|nr:ABC transporter permease [Ruminococcus sp.]
MNIFHKVTIESLKKNRTRTIVTIIGIMLSTALICAVTTSVSSMSDFARRFIIYETGSWHGMVKDAASDIYDEIESSDKVDKAVYCKYEGYAETESMNEDKPFLYIAGVSDGFDDIVPVHIKEGNYPQNDSEILIPEHILESGGVYYTVGEKITLEVGDRVNNGTVLGQEHPIYIVSETDGAAIIQDEEFVPRFTKEYTVCGIYERPSFENYESPGFIALVLASDDEIPTDSMSIYFTMKNGRDVFDFMKGECEVEPNNDLLMFSGISRYGSVMKLLYGFAAIVIGLIVFGSVMLIYNAFSISVSERTKQFGLLSSIGATKKQLKKMVKFESLVVSLTGIPLGILLGIAGMWVTFTCLGSKFASYTGGEVPDNINMKLTVSPVSIIAAVVIALVTIRISAWIPSRRATKVTAVEAIRLTSDIKAKKKKIRTPEAVYKLFGISGMLGHKYYKRSKKRYRSTIISLFMSIVLFISASAFTGYLVQTFETSTFVSGVDISYPLFHNENDKTKSDPDRLLKKMKNTDKVENVIYTADIGVMGMLKKEYLNKDLLTPDKAMILEYFNRSSDIEVPDDRINIFTACDFVDDDTFERMLEKYGLDKSEYMNEEHPKALIFDNSVVFNPMSERYIDLRFLSCDSCEIECFSHKEIDGYYYMYEKDGRAFYGKETDEDTDVDEEDVEYSEEDGYEMISIPADNSRIEYIFDVGKVIYEQLPYSTSGIDLLHVVYPYSFFDKVGIPGDTYSSCYFYIMSDEPDACFSNIEKMLKEERMPTNYLMNQAESERQTRSLITIVKVFAYGFIVLISLIAAANVFNTISTNIALRRREFAMLRSIGMTSKGIRKILNYECILYGVKSLMLGLPVSALVTYLIYRTVLGLMDTGFSMPWKAVGIAVFSVFAVVFATMMYSMSKLKNDNTIDALKNENL